MMIPCKEKTAVFLLPDGQRAATKTHGEGKFVSTHSPYKTTQAKLLFAGVASIAALILLNRMVTTPPGIEPEPEKTVPPTVVSESAGPVNQPERPAFLRDDRTRAEHLKVLVKQSGGDFNKLSQQDQRFVQTLSRGHGPEMLRIIAERDLKAQAKTKKKPQ